MAESIKYDDYTIYLLLSHLVGPEKYHVGVFVSLNGESGMIYHSTGYSGNFEFDSHLSQGIQFSRDIRLAMVIGRIRQEAQLDLIDTRIMPAVPVRNEDPSFNCWSWVKQALRDLRQAGLISFSCEADDIEKEARTFAGAVESRGQVGNDRVVTSRLCN